MSSNSYKRGWIDFGFDFITNSPTAGQVIKTGQFTSYGWDAENQQGTTAFKLAPDEVMEIEGLSILGPYGVRNAKPAGYRPKLKYVRLILNGQENELMSFNEHMTASRNSVGNRSGQGSDLWDGDQGINLGRGLLNGGDPWEATPKLNPGQSLEVEIGLPLASEGGDGTISQPCVVRVYYTKVKGESKLLYLLGKGREMGFGKPSLVKGNGSVDQNFILGDLETAEDMPPRLIEKEVPDGKNFKLTDWSSLYGGRNVGLPSINNYITYADNNVNTTMNTWFEFTQEGAHISEQFQELKWLNDQYNALRISHIGVLDHNDIRRLRLWRQGRSPEEVFRVDPGRNNFPMPTPREVNGVHHAGMSALPRPFWVWNELSSIQIMDNGTAIVDWEETAGTDIARGAEVAIMGKKYELER
jgi:hypothetical protein